MMLLITPMFWDTIYGWLSAMMQPLYWAISGLLTFWHWVFSPWFGADSGLTWLLSIVFLTVVVRTLLIPLFIKQINSARNMQLLQPKLQALQKKYGSDRQRLSTETMKLYQEEGVNPMASCLPLLLQMPVMLSLFRVLQGVADGNTRGYFFRSNPELTASLRDAELFGAGLSSRVFPFLPFGPTQVLGIVLVLLMVATLFVTQLQLMRKNMPPDALTGPMAQQQKLMLYLFPIIYAFTSVAVPLGVLLYWLTSNIWTMGQQGLLIRNNPAPNTPAYLDWEDRMRAKGKDPDKIMAERAAKRRRQKTTVTTTRKQETDAQSAGATSTDASPITDRPKVARQQVSRVTIRSDDGNRKVVRRQPRSQSRANRKKN